MKYIIMCGGKYRNFETPKHLTVVKGEPNVARTIRLLKEAGVEDIAISTNQEGFDNFEVPVLRHNNTYRQEQDATYGDWVDGFYLVKEPVCYIFGDVVFSPEAIKTIVETEVEDIMFFASAPPFCEQYSKPWAEPFAFKVINNNHFKRAIDLTKRCDEEGLFDRQPVSWELWQVIKQTPLNEIDYTNYVAINDYSCDIDYPEDVEAIERYIK